MGIFLFLSNLFNWSYHVLSGIPNKSYVLIFPVDNGRICNYTNECVQIVSSSYLMLDDFKEIVDSIVDKLTAL